MSDQSWTIYASLVLWLTVLGLAGSMTVAIYMVSQAQKVNRLRSNAKIIEETPSPDGSKNSNVKLVTQAEWLGWSSTRNTERQMQEINSALSQCQCSCNCSERQDTNNG